MQFRDKNKSIRTIAKLAKIGVTATRSQYINNFMHLCGNETPEARQKRIDDARKAASRARHVVRLPEFPEREELIASAEKAGLAVTAHLFTRVDGRVTGISRTIIDVSAVPCHLHFVRTARNRKNRQAVMGVVEMSPNTAASTPIHLIIVAVPGFSSQRLVIPTGDLPRAHKGEDMIRFTIRLRMGSRLVKEKFDTRTYRDQWRHVTACIPGA